MRIYFQALIASLVVFGAHNLGIQYFYLNTYGYDSFMHLLGGVAIGLCVLVASKILNSSVLRTLAGVCAGVLVVGIAWEMFESYYEISLLPGQTYWFDTIKDIVMDVIGGSIAFKLFGKKKI